MNIWDMLILALVGGMLILAFRGARGRGKGSCCGSSTCACGMDRPCAGCSRCRGGESAGSSREGQA